MLGLKRGTVELLPHDERWAKVFADAAGRIRAQVGEIVTDVQHVGSTSVPDLLAKPILDIAIAVATREHVEMVARRLVEIGYIDRGDNGSDGGYLLVRQDQPDIRTEHIHIVEDTDPQWRAYLRFRDLLRHQQPLRRRYARLKRTLARRHPNDRTAYTHGKHEFIRSVVGELLPDAN